MRTQPRARDQARALLKACALALWLVSGGLAAGLVCAEPAHAEPAHADATQAIPDVTPKTFSYTTAADENYPRALLEFSTVISLGFLQYVTERDLIRDYNVNYSWHMFRRKLLFQALELDTNQIGTNFISHPIAGSMYYLSARSNHLSIPESLGISIGGSLLWEYFGEVREIVSLNDMLVTPLAGIAIGEPVMQLGAFFDRSAPTLRNRALAVFFTPIKSLNDWLDGRHLVRAERFDAYGFPQNEGHQFDLAFASVATWQEHAPRHGVLAGTQAWRWTLASHLARLPDYDGAGHHSLGFSDGNLSSFEVSGSAAVTGITDLDVETQLVSFGYYARDATLDARGRLWGHGTVVGFTSSYQFTLHDYDRDRLHPMDQLTSIEPLGVLIEQRSAFGSGRAFVRLSAGGDFGGVRPYALEEYRVRSDTVTLPFVLDQHLYYYGLGGRVALNGGLGVGPVEAQAKLRFEGYSAVQMPVTIADERTLLEARVSSGFPGTPLRLALVTQLRSRWGHMALAHAQRSELGAGFEIGARY